MRHLAKSFALCVDNTDYRSDSLHLSFRRLSRYTSSLYEHSKRRRRVGADDASSSTASLQSLPRRPLSGQDDAPGRLVSLHGV